MLPEGLSVMRFTFLRQDQFLWNSLAPCSNIRVQNKVVIGLATPRLVSWMAEVFYSHDSATGMKLNNTIFWRGTVI